MRKSVDLETQQESYKTEIKNCQTQLQDNIHGLRLEKEKSVSIKKQNKNLQLLLNNITMAKKNEEIKNAGKNKKNNKKKLIEKATQKTIEKERNFTNTNKISDNTSSTTSLMQTMQQELDTLRPLDQALADLTNSLHDITIKEGNELEMLGQTRRKVKSRNNATGDNYTYCNDDDSYNEGDEDKDGKQILLPPPLLTSASAHTSSLLNPNRTANNNATRSYSQIYSQSNQSYNTSHNDNKGGKLNSAINTSNTSNTDKTGNTISNNAAVNSASAHTSSLVTPHNFSLYQHSFSSTASAPTQSTHTHNLARDMDDKKQTPSSNNPINQPMSDKHQCWLSIPSLPILSPLLYEKILDMSYDLLNSEEQCSKLKKSLLIAQEKLENSMISSEKDLLTLENKIEKIEKTYWKNKNLLVKKNVLLDKKNSNQYILDEILSILSQELDGWESYFGGYELNIYENKLKKNSNDIDNSNDCINDSIDKHINNNINDNIHNNINNDNASHTYNISKNKYLSPFKPPHPYTTHISPNTSFINPIKSTTTINAMSNPVSPNHPSSPNFPYSPSSPYNTSYNSPYNPYSPNLSPYASGGNKRNKRINNNNNYHNTENNDKYNNDNNYENNNNNNSNNHTLNDSKNTSKTYSKASHRIPIPVHLLPELLLRVITKSNDTISHLDSLEHTLKATQAGK